ncbi:MAG: hypothetical protein VX181_11380, partial [Pseudomonadota bacterium]|nr:hypothetical protein [Pseudomonadota bacterium]
VPPGRRIPPSERNFSGPPAQQPRSSCRGSSRRQQQAQQVPQEYEDEVEQDRIEIPAFLRRQAN